MLLTPALRVALENLGDFSLLMADTGEMRHRIQGGRLL